jgi:steroid delta-isomerase
MTENAAERYIRYLETLTPESLGQLSDYVCPDIHFRDPFHDRKGIEPLGKIFEHMFETLKDVRFRVITCASNGNRCLMQWQLTGLICTKPCTIEGMSTVTFSGDGRVSSHIDYWDAASQLYERLPVIGWLLSAIRRHIAKTQTRRSAAQRAAC